MPDTTLDPKAIAKAVAIEVADEDNQVGDFVQAIELDDCVTDFRFETNVRGYEGWQWSVTLYHDVELDRWTVNESSLVPTGNALRPPEWIPWKDRLEPTDLAVTDSIGTDPDDPRIEEGFRKTQAETTDETQDDARNDSAQELHAEGLQDGEPDVAESSDTASQDASESDDAHEDTETARTSDEDLDEAVRAFDLSRRHVMTPLGRSQTAKRWYEGPRGPKSLSTKTADGNPCSTCGFFIPLKGELNLLFGVCANKWSPDDGRVVSLDHGCGEHSEIDPPEPSRLWVQSKPAFDDLHIDIIAQSPRDERGSVELIERLSADDDENPNNEEDASEEDIEANTIDDDATQDEVSEHTSSEEEPEVEATVDLGMDDDADDSEDAADDISDDDSEEDSDEEESEENMPEEIQEESVESVADESPDESQEQMQSETDSTDDDMTDSTQTQDSE